MESRPGQGCPARMLSNLLTQETIMRFTAFPHGLGLQIWVGLRGHTYVVSAFDSHEACIGFGTIASDPDLDFSWLDAAKANAFSRKLFHSLGVKS